VIPEKNILKDQDGSVTLKAVDNEGTEIIQSKPGAEFLWLLLCHVLPKHFRRVRDFGLLHGNAKAVVRLLQMLLNLIALHLIPIDEKQPVVRPPHCPSRAASSVFTVRRASWRACSSSR
jgi:hypothetical protein